MNDNIQRIIGSGSTGQQALFKRLEAIILELYPNAEQTISNNMPTYKTRQGQVSLGFWQGGVCLSTDNPLYVAKFKRDNPKVKGDKASIDLTPGEELPLNGLRAVIKQAMEGS